MKVEIPGMMGFSEASGKFGSGKFGFVFWAIVWLFHGCSELFLAVSESPFA